MTTTSRRNTVICFKGMSNGVRGNTNTNVLRLRHLRALDTPDTQVAYDGPGGGISSAASAWSSPAHVLSRGLGLAFGARIRPALGNAYRFLMSVGARLRSMGWPYTSSLPHARPVRSAVALDEWRWRYRPVFVLPSRGRLSQPVGDVEQLRLAEGHSDVDGRYADEGRLSGMPLEWMAKEAVQVVLLVSSGRLRGARGLVPGLHTSPDDDRLIGLMSAEATAPTHGHSPVWLVAGRQHRRPLPRALVHAGARVRLDDSCYAELQEGCRFADEDWTDLSWVPAPRGRRQEVGQRAVENAAGGW